MPSKLYQRSKLAQTASALKSVPSWNFTPSLSVNSWVRPSSLDSQDSASSGAGSAVPGSTPTRPSKIWRETRKDSPSEAKAGSRLLGSEEAAKMKLPSTDDSEPEPPLSPESSRWLWAQLESSSAAAAAAAVTADRRRRRGVKDMVPPM